MNASEEIIGVGLGLAAVGCIPQCLQNVSFEKIEWGEKSDRLAFQSVCDVSFEKIEWERKESQTRVPECLQHCG